MTGDAAYQAEVTTLQPTIGRTLATRLEAGTPGR